VAGTPVASSGFQHLGHLSGGSECIGSSIGLGGVKATGLVAGG
jgi:hypothetical protein